VEQLGGIAQGVALPMKLLATDSNAGKVQAIWRLRTHLWAVAWGGLLAACMAGLCWARWWYLKRQLDANHLAQTS